MPYYYTPPDGSHPPPHHYYGHPLAPPSAPDSSQPPHTASSPNEQHPPPARSHTAGPPGYPPYGPPSGYYYPPRPPQGSAAPPPPPPGPQEHNSPQPPYSGASAHGLPPEIVKLAEELFRQHGGMPPPPPSAHGSSAPPPPHPNPYGYPPEAYGYPPPSAGKPPPGYYGAPPPSSAAGAPAPAPPPSKTPAPSPGPPSVAHPPPPSSSGATPSRKPSQRPQSRTSGYGYPAHSVSGDPNTSVTAAVAAAAAAAKAKENDDIHFAQWGRLVEVGSEGSGKEPKPTPALTNLFKDIAAYVIKKVPPEDSIVITPDKMDEFYAANKVHNELQGWEWQGFFRGRSSASLASVYRALNCEHFYVPPPSGHPGSFSEKPCIPALTPRGFETWMFTQLMAYPDREAVRIQKILDFWPISNSSGERYRKLIPRRCFPDKEDPVIRSGWWRVYGEIPPDLEEYEEQRVLALPAAPPPQHNDSERSSPIAPSIPGGFPADEPPHRKPTQPQVSREEWGRMPPPGHYPPPPGHYYAHYPPNDESEEGDLTDEEEDYRRHAPAAAPPISGRSKTPGPPAPQAPKGDTASLDRAPRRGYPPVASPPGGSPSWGREDLNPRPTLGEEKSMHPYGNPNPNPNYHKRSQSVHGRKSRLEQERERERAEYRQGPSGHRARSRSRPAQPRDKSPDHTHSSQKSWSGSSGISARTPSGSGPGDSPVGPPPSDDRRGKREDYRELEDMMRDERYAHSRGPGGPPHAMYAGRPPTAPLPHGLNPWELDYEIVPKPVGSQYHPSSHYSNPSISSSTPYHRSHTKTPGPGTGSNPTSPVAPPPAPKTPGPPPSKTIAPAPPAAPKTPGPASGGGGKGGERSDRPKEMDILLDTLDRYDEIQAQRERQRTEETKKMADYAYQEDYQREVGDRRGRRGGGGGRVY
ncbi:hypothetical protein RUND412_008391 [Rhizina undulata]